MLRPPALDAGKHGHTISSPESTPAYAGILDAQPPACKFREAVSGQFHRHRVGMMPRMARSVMRRRGHETVRQGLFPVRLAFRIRTVAGREFLSQTRTPGETSAPVSWPREHSGPSVSPVSEQESTRRAECNGGSPGRCAIDSAYRAVDQPVPSSSATRSTKSATPCKSISGDTGIPAVPAPPRRLSKRFAPCGSSRAGAGCRRRKRHRFQFQNIRPGAMSGSARFSRTVDANPPILFRLCEMQVPRLAPFRTDPHHSVAQRMPDAGAAFGRSL